MFEAFEQQVGNHHSQFSWREASTFFLGVLTFLNGGENRGIGGRPAHAVRFQLLHQRCFVEPGRRLGEVLFRVDRLELQRLALGDYGKAALQLFVVFVFLIFTFLIYR